MQAIEVKDIQKYYGTTKAVDGISFSVPTGEIFGMLGPNGAGKTTATEIIEGLRTPDSVTVTVLGLDVARHARQVKTRIGIQPQTTACRSPTWRTRCARLWWGRLRRIA
jgi:ABC-2 type transport system ATP-binding protein